MTRGLICQLQMASSRKSGSSFPRMTGIGSPGRPRGIYMLLDKAGKKKYIVVYVGGSVSNVNGRLASHARSKKKRDH